MIFDTDILIWVFRGNPKAARELERAKERMTSVVTVMELYQGARSRGEIRTISQFFQRQGITVLPLSEPIGDTAVALIEEYASSAGLQLADALIAATARQFGLPLVTGNARHFRRIPRLELRPFRPVAS